MARMRTTLLVLSAAAAIALALPAVLEAVDTEVDYDKAFDFKPLRTWGWNPAGMGEVKMARTPDDDPDAMTRMVEPVMRDAMSQEMTKRGLTESASAPDVVVTYYVLLTTSMSAQTLGQFLPAYAAWGLPPFAPSTQSLKVMNRGALVVDMKAKDKFIWRGVAQAEVEIGIDQKKREAKLRDGVRDLIKRFPPK